MYITNLQRKYIPLILCLIVIALLVNWFPRLSVLGAEEEEEKVSYTFTISGTNVEFVDNRGNVYKTEPLTFNVTIPTTKDNIPILQYSGYRWCAQSWNGNSEFLSKDNTYGYTSTLTNDYLGVFVKELNKNTTTIPLYDFTTDKAYWLGEEYATMEELREVFFAGIEEQQKDVMAAQYPSPVFQVVADDSNHLYFGLAGATNNPYKLEGKFYVDYLTPDGILHTNEEIKLREPLTIAEKKEGVIAPGIWELTYTADVFQSGWVELRYDELAKYIKDYRDIDTFTLKSVKIKCRYMYHSGDVSNYSEYKYDYDTKDFNGNYYDPTKNDYVTSDPNDTTVNVDTDTGVVITPIDNKNTLQSIIDWFTNSLTTITTNISKVFANFIKLFSEVSGFFTKIGEIFTILLGSELGTLISISMLTVCLIGILKAVRG